MIFFIVVKKVKSSDLDKDHVDIEAIRERLSSRFGKDVHDLATSKEEDLRTLKQKLSEKFKSFKVPTLCGVRYRQITSFRARDIPDSATSRSVNRKCQSDCHQVADMRFTSVKK